MGRSRWSSGSRHFAGLDDADDDTLCDFYGFEKFSRPQRGRHERYAEALTPRVRDRRPQRRRGESEFMG